PAPRPAARACAAACPKPPRRRARRGLSRPRSPPASAAPSCAGSHGLRPPAPACPTGSSHLPDAVVLGGAYRKTRKAKSRPRGRLFMALAMEVRLRRGGDDVPALARRAGRGQDLVRAPPVAGERLALGEELVVVGVGEHELAVLEHVDHLAGDRLAQRRATPAAA